MDVDIYVDRRHPDVICLDNLLVSLMRFDLWPKRHVKPVEDFIPLLMTLGNLRQDKYEPIK